jgi:hypothetical protein
MITLVSDVVRVMEVMKRDVAKKSLARRLRPCTCGVRPAKAQPKAEPRVAEFPVVHVALASLDPLQKRGGCLPTNCVFK